MFWLILFVNIFSQKIYSSSEFHHSLERFDKVLHSQRSTSSRREQTIMFEPSPLWYFLSWNCISKGGTLYGKFWKTCLCKKWANRKQKWRVRLLSSEMGQRISAKVWDKGHWNWTITLNFSAANLLNLLAKLMKRKI